MNLIRIYFMPKGYEDIICNSVEITSSNDAIIRGGKLDGKKFYLVRGAMLLKENVYEQLELKLEVENEKD